MYEEIISNDRIQDFFDTKIAMMKAWREVAPNKAHGQDLISGVIKNNMYKMK